MNQIGVFVAGVLILQALCLCSCTRHKVEVAPVEVKPIHITIDVYVKVDKELDDFFDDIDSVQETTPESEEVTDAP